MLPFITIPKYYSGKITSKTRSGGNAIAEVPGSLNDVAVFVGASPAGDKRGVDWAFRLQGRLLRVGCLAGVECLVGAIAHWAMEQILSLRG